jgi:hypothetical protein
MTPSSQAIAWLSDLRYLETVETPREIMDTSFDEKYLRILVDPIRVCAKYKPKMGQGVASGLSLTEFQSLYRGDPFYGWYGLDHPLMYAAHKAAGGMTSIYRQIGIGAERLFREVLVDNLDLTEDQATWSYKTSTAAGKERTLYLDGRIEFEHVQDLQKRRNVKAWVGQAARELGVQADVCNALRGVAFEVRQGYKSKDSKRQNADIANASTAYTQALLPCVIVLSTQIDSDIVTRYRMEKWTLLIGSTADKSTTRSTYAFMQNVVGFDLAGFFGRNSAALKNEVDAVLKTLLSPN